MALIDTEQFRKKFFTLEIEFRPSQIDAIFDCIESSEVIDAQPVVHGHWVGISDGDADGFPVYDEWECSHCGVVFEDEEPPYKYCPNCGAKMDAQEDRQCQTGLKEH